MKTQPVLVTPGSKIDLADYDPADRGQYQGKREADEELVNHLQKLAELQELLYAESKHALLIVLQGMDAAGKDGTVRHVMNAFNPQGVRVVSFKVPTPEELAHDFLWRVHKVTPRLGETVIFNRSHYEDVLVVRVDGLVPKPVWKARYDAHQPLRANAERRRGRHLEVLPAHIERGAEETAAGSIRGSHQAMEILRRRREQANAMGRLSATPTPTR